MATNEEEEPINSQILITFAAPNSVVMDIQLHNVSPLQAIAAAWLLEKQGEGGFVQQEMARKSREEMGHIAVPGGVRMVKKP